MLAKIQWKIQRLQKVILSIVNSEAYTSHFKTKKLSDGHHGEFTWKTWIQTKTAKDIYSPYEKIPNMQIPIEMTGKKTFTKQQ